MPVNEALVVAAVIVVALFIVTELLLAVVPLLLVITLVPPAERRDVTELLAAVDGSRRSRVARTTRLARAAHRLLRSSPDRPPS